MKRKERERPLTPDEAARINEVRQQYQRTKPGPETIEEAGGTLIPNRQAWMLLTIGTEIRRERERQGLSLKQLANRCGLDEPALSRIETGRNPNPTIETLNKVAKALGKVVCVSLEEEATNPA